MPRERLAGLKAAVEAAGLELLSVGISPAATAELVTRAEKKSGAADETSLVVARHGRRVEISMMRSQHLIFTHSTQVTGDNDEQDSRLALAEIRRSHGSLARLDPTLVIRRGWVVGTEEETAVLRSVLGENLGYEVRQLDPASDDGVEVDPTEIAGTHSQYAGPLGMLLARLATSVPAVDLLNPRKSVVRPDRRRLWAAVAAAAAVVVIVATFIGVRVRASGLDGEIETAQKRLQRMDEAIKRDSLLTDVAVVDDWSHRKVDLLAQIQAVKDAIKNPGRLYLTEVRFASTAGRSAGELTGIGHAKEREDAQRLWDDLAAAGYQVRASEITRDSPDGEYPFRFGLSVLIATTGEKQPQTADR
jgi:hypothetical protein